MEPVYMTPPQAAEYTGLSESYLAKLRMTTVYGSGPNFIRLGLRAIRYRRADLDDWMVSKTVVTQAAKRIN
ncbi:helix-turn-helix transcriptional regulator [Octadecabacter arcticus]|jgi:predicted DNA-binding transcriptional regulator AlpA|uniref:helix-turn-helix transcriptional regulator n=1 Tax=Octadecabacter arcticus TaxID=53946 RepID=UPI0002F1198D|nr:helix-turn-helix domain-containing protein [Octadecabacter arcticus]